MQELLWSDATAEVTAYWKVLRNRMPTSAATALSSIAIKFSVIFIKQEEKSQSLDTCYYGREGGHVTKRCYIKPDSSTWQAPCENGT